MRKRGKEESHDARDTLSDQKILGVRNLGVLRGKKGTLQKGTKRKKNVAVSEGVRTKRKCPEKHVVGGS